MNQTSPEGVVRDNAGQSKADGRKDNDEIERRVADALRKQRERGDPGHTQAATSQGRDPTRAQPTHSLTKAPDRVIEFPAPPGKDLHSHSPALLERWEERRDDALQAVREGINNGSFDSNAGEHLMRLLHKLAGTAAMFGEPELGDRAAALERALRQPLDTATQLGLAGDLLNIAKERRGKGGLSAASRG